MNKKKLSLIAIGCVLLCLVVLREIGVVDLNLYISTLSTSQVATRYNTYPEQEQQFSYQLIVTQNNETLFDYTHIYNNQPPIQINGVLDEPIYSGNFVLPLVKNFRMTYQCEFNTTNSPDGHTVSGKIEGEVTAEIFGFCSRRKAKELAFEKVMKQMISVL
ncbi:hypothetical protein [Spirochaeta dissipatitropha]